jgi:long-chain acyl-CoA synthetase
MSDVEQSLPARPPSVPAMFFDRVAATPDDEAFRYPADGEWLSLTWAQAAERVRAIAAGLLQLGVGAEQRVAILATTRVEWILADNGILCAGAATTTVYPTTSAEEAAYILGDSGSKVVFADGDQLAKLREIRDSLPGLEKVVIFDGESDGDWVISLDDLCAAGRELLDRDPDAVDRASKAVGPENLATLIYTSGTTGRPKGVRLVHDNWTYIALVQQATGLISPDDVQYLWLPLSHSFGRALLTGQLTVGFPMAVDGRIEKIVENLPVVRPTIMAAAPRIFEKVYNRIVSTAKAAGGAKWRIFQWAVAVGREVSRLRQAGQEPGGVLKLKYSIADKVVFSKVRERFGGRLRGCVSGSAPLAREIAEFFDAAGIPIFEGYGLTETSAGGSVNLREANRFGTVGRPMPGTEARIAEDGEILLRGPLVMRGYHNLPEQTAEVLEADGWFHTGDIGEIDEAGHLRITDRKKDLIKTSGGKYVAPTFVEGQFKAACPYVSQVLVHGHGRNFCTALITLDPDAIAGWAAQNGLGDRSYEQLVTEPAVRELIEEYVAEVNGKLQRWETIKRFEILPRDLSIEDGELTPSLKVKRRVVEANYDGLLKKMYEGSLEEV